MESYGNFFGTLKRNIMKSLRCVDPPALLRRLSLIIDETYRLGLRRCTIGSSRHDAESETELDSLEGASIPS